MTLLGIRWRFYRPAEPRRGWDAAALLMAIYAFAVFSGVMWSRSVENSTAFWTANGVLAAGLLLLRPKVGALFAAACIAVNAGLNIVAHLPVALNIAYTSLNLLLTLAVVGLVRTFCGASLDLGRLRRFLPFLLIVACATAIEGLIGSVIMPRRPDTYLVIWQRWASCDAIGMALGLPATLMFMRRLNPLYAGPAERSERLALLVLAGIGAYAAFSISAAPVFLLIYPAILFGAFRLGSAWAFVAVWVIAQASTVQTLANKGPLAVFDGPPPFIGLGILQLFLVSLLLTASLATSALAERMRSEHRLRRKAATTAAARARADQVTATRERFLAVVGHEIRTPLNGILGFGEALAKRSDLDPEARRHVEMIGRSTEALMEIVNDILDYSQIETGHLELNAVSADLGQPLSRALEAARPAAAAKGLALTVSSNTPADVSHLIDARRLQQVLGHLIGNAVKFTDAGRVEVSVDCLPMDGRDAVTIAVSDTGGGVPEHQRQELFRPFAQLDASLSRKHSGAGLGLSICRSIVELMGGEIAYAPRPGGGSIFTVSLSLVRVEAQEEEDLSERAPRILVVDDHPTNREVARLFLDAFGCEVAECEDGAAAVEAARATAFDVILMDVRMPGVDGLAATRMIRALDGPAAQTPILAVTADVMREDIERCRAVGMNGHVPKPINQTTLLNALTCALQGRDAFPADLAA